MFLQLNLLPSNELTVELVEYEKQPVEVQDPMKITPQLLKEKLKARSM